MEPAWSIESFAWDGYALAAQPAAGPSASTGLGFMDLLTSGTSQQFSTDLAKSHKKGMKRTGSYLPHCQVAGCSADLSRSRAYYRRYRICEAHFRAASLIIDSKVMRFCQQCAKFESLSVFEGDKRSCRRQLDRHNERRSRRRNKRGGKRQSPGCSLMDSCDDSDDSSGGMAQEATLPDEAIADLMRGSNPGKTSYKQNNGQSLATAAQSQPKPPLTPLQQQLLALQASESETVGQHAEDWYNLVGSTSLYACTGNDNRSQAVGGVDLANSWPDLSEESGLYGRIPDVADPDFLNVEPCNSVADAAMKLVAMWQGQEQQQHLQNASACKTGEPGSANSSVHGGCANTSAPTMPATISTENLFGMCQPYSNGQACNPASNKSALSDSFMNSQQHQLHLGLPHGLDVCNLATNNTPILGSGKAISMLGMAATQPPEDGFQNTLWNKDVSGKQAGGRQSESNHTKVPSHWRFPKPQSHILTRPGGSQLHPVLANLTASQPNVSNQSSASLLTSTTPRAQSDVRYPSIWASPLPEPMQLPSTSQAPWSAVGRQAASKQRTNNIGQQNQNLASKLNQANYLLVELSLTRLSIKLHGVTPEALPEDLREALTEWLARTDERLLQGFIRPGCVHLTLDCITATKPSTVASNVSFREAGWNMPEQNPLPGKITHGLDSLLPSQPSMGLPTAGGYALPTSLAGLFSSCTIVEIQSPSKLVLMEGQAVWSVSNLEKRPNLPKIRCLTPMVLLVGERGPSVTVEAENLEGDHRQGSNSSATTISSVQIYVRSQGRFIQDGKPTCTTPTMPHRQVSVAQQYSVAVDTSGLEPGLAVVEAQAGRLLSNFCPVLLVNDIDMVHEIEQLQSMQHLYPDRINALLTDLGLLLQLQSIRTNVGTASQQHADGGEAGNDVHGFGLGHVSEDLPAHHGIGEQDSTHSWSDDDDTLTAPSVSDGEDEDFDEAIWEQAQHEAVGVDAMATDIPVPTNQQAIERGNDMADNSWGSSMTQCALAYEEKHALKGLQSRSQQPDYGVQGGSGDSTRNCLGWFNPDVKKGLATRALRLLAFACDAGWPRTARTLINILTTVPLVETKHTRHSRHITALTIEDVLSSTVSEDGLTPLVRAVRAGSLATVRELLSIARTAGLNWNFASNRDASIGSTLSVLHCAARLHDSSIALALLASSPTAPLEWFTVKSAEGFTPAELAITGGCRSVNAVARLMVQRLAGK